MESKSKKLDPCFKQCSVLQEKQFYREYMFKSIHLKKKRILGKTIFPYLKKIHQHGKNVWCISKGLFVQTRFLMSFFTKCLKWSQKVGGLVWRSKAGLPDSGFWV